MKKRMHAIVRIETISKRLEKKGETCTKKVKRKREKKKKKKKEKKKKKKNYLSLARLGPHLLGGGRYTETHTHK